MQYSIYTFKTRAEARGWLIDNGFTPQRDATRLGMWEHAKAGVVQAYANANHTWSVKKVDAQKPENFISE